MPANRPARSHSQPQLSRESRKNPHKKFLASPSDLNLTLTEIVYPACNTRELTFEPRPPTFCHKEHSPGLKTSCPRGASGVASRPAVIAPQSSCGHASALDMTPSTTPKRNPQRAQRSNRAGLTVTRRGPGAISNGRTAPAFRRLVRSCEARASFPWAPRLARAATDSRAATRPHHFSDPLCKAVKTIVVSWVSGAR
jgi:hypothetical protein